jgi:hypothetical protein
LTDVAIYKWALGVLGTGLLALLSFLGGQLSMYDEIKSISNTLAVMSAEIQINSVKLDAVQQRIEDFHDPR